MSSTIDFGVEQKMDENLKIAISFYVDAVII